MKVLVDTSIWSLAFRHRKQNGEKAILEKLIQEHQVVIIGPIRQETLSGIKDEGQFENLRKMLGYFPDTEITTHAYELAAKNFNTCRSNGITGSHIDFLICAVSIEYDFSIYTTDKDFELYAECLPISLYLP